MRVVVLGAGVIGVTSAYALLQDGHEVTVVERRQGAGQETSWGNGAILHASSVEPWSAPGVPLQALRSIGHEDAPLLLRLGALPHMWRWGAEFLRNCTASRHRETARLNLRLALESLEAMAEIRSTTGLAYDRATESVLKLFPDAASLDASRREHEDLAADGLVTEVWDRAACLAREPIIAEAAAPVAGGLFFPQDELGDGHKLSHALVGWCAERGVDFRFGHVVQALLRDGARVSGVATDKGDIEADAVVVALGSFSPFILRGLGIRLPVYPVKGVSVTVPRSFWPDAPRMALLNPTRGFAIVPLGDRLRLVGSAEVTGYDARPAATRIQAVVDRASQLFPQLASIAQHKDAAVWAGLRPVMADGRPNIGPTGIDGLWLNTGHGHFGWTTAAGSARRLAQSMTTA